MERRVTSHTEEEEMNQRRRLLMLARKGDQQAVELLFELYQVRVFSGDALKRKKLPSFPLPNAAGASGRGQGKGKKMGKIPKLSSEVPSKPAPSPPHDLKKKTKETKPSTEKGGKGRPLSSQKTGSKTSKMRKPASTSKIKNKKPTLSARSSRVKKK